MIETATDQFLHDVSRVTFIWLGLMLFALVVMASLLARISRQPTGEPARNPDDGQRADTGDGTTGHRRFRLAAGASELDRHAEDIAVIAAQAAATAQCRREEWLAEQERAEAAWRAFEAADEKVRRLTAAAVLPSPRTPQTPAEYVDRERYLHRSVRSACLRKELSVLELSDALANRNGWDPRHHPVEQELILSRAARDALRAAERTAAGRERAAWRDAEVAAVAARNLRQEALDAAERAREARYQLTRVGPRRRPIMARPWPPGEAASRAAAAVGWVAPFARRAVGWLAPLARRAGRWGAAAGREVARWRAARAS